MLVLGIDFETQDDDPTTTRVTEVGAILVEFDRAIEGIHALGKSYIEEARIADLCWDPSYPPQTPKIVELTGITDHMLTTFGKPTREVFAERLFPLVKQAELIVAYNKAFDQVVYESTCKALDLQTPLLPWPLPWLCAYSEVPYPEKFTCRKLTHLAWEHDLQVDREKAHRADYDVELMLNLISLYNINEVLAYSKEPWIYLQAIIPAPWTDNGVGKAKASKLGYGWERARGDERVFPKSWIKRVKARNVDGEKEAAKRVNMDMRVLS